MSKSYLIYGTKRCGHHAIIDWLMPQIGDVIRFYNDRKYVFYQPIDEDVDEHTMVEHILELRSKVALFIDGVKQRTGKNYEYKDARNIISFEGIELNQMLETKNKWLQDMNRGIQVINPDLVISDDMEYVVVIRNPWNIAASQIRWSLDRPDDYVGLVTCISNRVDKDMIVWNEFYENYINKKPDTHFIIYDKWFQDIEYRKKISSELGLEFNDLNINRVSNAGEGSSFTKMTFDGKAQEMNVLNRYKEMMDHPRMQERFLNTDIANETKNKWNHICDLEKIVELKIK